MDWILTLVSFLISSLNGIWQAAITPEQGPMRYKKSPTVDDVMDIPSGLLIGAGISSYQHEGPQNTTDRAMSVLDYRFNRIPTTGFYDKYKEDIHLLKDIGFDSFRFSISWSRLLPNGTPDDISEDAESFYNRTLDELEKRGIKPFVTIYHWDHPQKFQEDGGWLNETMIYRFANYARVVFKKFGNRVKYFGTINQPKIYCRFVLPPGKSSYDYPFHGISHEISQKIGGLPKDVAKYKCHQNMLKAHALAYRIYDEEFRHLQNGQVGIIELCDAYYPYSTNTKDIEAVQIAHEFGCGLTFHPIFTEKGGYPEIMKTRIAERSKSQGYNESRLPELSKEWIEKIKNSSDFMGLTHYTTMIAKQSNGDASTWSKDEGIEYSTDPSWPQSNNIHFSVVPEGFRVALTEIKRRYNNVPVFVLENGALLKNGTNDDSRAAFHHAYMKQMLMAIAQDKCDVRMYSVWSFLDGLEWSQEKGLTFGIVQVDFDSANRTRTPKKSALWFKKTLASRKIRPPGVY